MHDAASSPSSTSDPTGAPGPASSWTLAISSLAVFAVFLDTTVLFVAFPDIAASFPDVAPSELSWVLNGYTIAFAGLLIPLGRVADRRGHKAMFIAGSVVFTVYLADYLPSMVFTGVGVALCLPQLSSVIGQALPPDRLGVGGAVNQALRQFAGTVGVALTIGLTAGATGLADALVRFDRVWWVLIIGGLATTACSIPLRTRRTAAARPDGVGGADGVPLAVVGD